MRIGLVAALACLVPTPIVRGQLTVAEDANGVTIRCSAGETWRVVVDKNHGGVVSEFRLPAPGAG